MTGASETNVDICATADEFGVGVCGVSDKEACAEVNRGITCGCMGGVLLVSGNSLCMLPAVSALRPAAMVHASKQGQAANTAYTCRSHSFVQTACALMQSAFCLCSSTPLACCGTPPSAACVG